MSKSNSAVLKIMWKWVEPQKKSTTSNPFYWILKDKKANTMSAGYVLFRLDLPLNMKPAAAGDPEAKADSCIQFADRLNIKASVCSCTCCSDQSFTCIWSVLVSAAAGTAGRKLCWAVISERSWRNGYRIFLNLFFTSMKLLFHSLAWILRTAWPEKLWRGHWNRMQRADPKRQSWRKRQTAKILWGQTESAIKLVINKSGGACIFFFCASCVW